MPHPRRLAALIHTPSEVLPHLYLSGLYTAIDEEQLVALGVTHIVSVLEQKPLYPRSLPKLKTLHVPLPDVDDADILHHLNKTTDFIRRALEDKRNTVLVSTSILSLSLFTQHPSFANASRVLPCLPIFI